MLLPACVLLPALPGLLPARESGWLTRADLCPVLREFCESFLRDAQTTVREALLFSGRLRQPASIKYATLRRFVAEVCTFWLCNCLNAYVIMHHCHYSSPLLIVPGHWQGFASASSDSAHRQVTFEERLLKCNCYTTLTICQTDCDSLMTVFREFSLRVPGCSFPLWGLRHCTSACQRGR